MADDDQVIVRQTMLNVDEVFLYALPPLKTAGGHRAEDWNLAKPIETCTLRVERVGDELHLVFRKQSDDSVFARSIIDLSSSSSKQEQPPQLQHFCEDVVDSSRYFTVRITDDKSGREARVGIGFRERDYATNFRMSLQDYQNSLLRERKAHEMQEAYENKNGSSSNNDQATESNSTWSLKAGEKIHVNRGGKSTITQDAAAASAAAAPPTVISPVLLKKPPPSPAQQEQMRISLAGMQIPDDIDQNHHNDDDGDGTDSDVAVAENEDEDDDSLS